MKPGKKAKHPALALLWLIMIPFQIVMDFVLVTLGAWADTSMANTSMPGHPAPAVVILATVVAVAFTILVPLTSVIITIVRFVILNKRYKAARNTPMPAAPNIQGQQ